MTALRTVRIEASKIVLDHDLSPRVDVDEQHVTELEEAMLAGAKLPNLIVDERFWLVDGYHRLRALKRVFGIRCKPLVDVHTYADNAEFFLAAVAANAAHGRRLTPGDVERVKTIGVRLHVSADRLAANLGLRVERLDGKVQATRLPSTLNVRSIRPRTTAPAQQRQRGTADGPLIWTIGDIVEALTRGKIPLTDRLRRSLRELHDAIHEAGVLEDDVGTGS